MGTAVAVQRECVLVTRLRLVERPAPPQRDAAQVVRERERRNVALSLRRRQGPFEPDVGFVVIALERTHVTEARGEARGDADRTHRLQTRDRVPQRPFRVVVASSSGRDVSEVPQRDRPAPRVPDCGEPVGAAAQLRQRVVVVAGHQRDRPVEQLDHGATPGVVDGAERGDRFAERGDPFVDALEDLDQDRSVQRPGQAQSRGVTDRVRRVRHRLGAVLEASAPS